MATIPRTLIDELTRKLGRISGATQSTVRKLLESLNYTDIADLRRKAIELLEPLFAVSTDMAAAASAEFYDEVRAIATGKPIGAQVVSNRNPEATAGAIRALVIRAELDVESFILQMLLRADYEIKRASGECIEQNVMADSRAIGFARVPSGAETCDWCLWLASFGFVYKSKRSAGQFSHWHSGCDCRIVPGFNGMEVEGYNPWEIEDELRGMIRDLGIKDKEYSQLSREERNALSRELKKRRSEQ